MQTDSGGHKGTDSNFNHSAGFSSFITPTSSMNLISTLKLIRVQCMYLSTTTLFDGRGVYIAVLHKVQLHVSALDNGHLQVVHEILSKQLYETWLGCIEWGGMRRGGHETSYIS